MLAYTDSCTNASNDHYTRVVVEVDRETDYEFNRLSRPARLYFDLFGARLATDLRNSPPLAVNDERIKQIRLGQYRRTTARVVFDLGSPVRYRASWLANPPRFVVEVGLSKNDAFVAETIDSPSSARNPSAALPGPGKAGEIALAETKDPARPRQPVPQSPPAEPKAAEQPDGQAIAAADRSKHADTPMSSPVAEAVPTGRATASGTATNAIAGKAVATPSTAPAHVGAEGLQPPQTSGSVGRQAFQVPAALYSVSGVVSDPSGAVVQGAVVTLRSKDKASDRSTTTDSEGRFQFSGIPAGRHKIEVRQEGFQVTRARLKVARRDAGLLRIVLKIAKVYEDITVVESKQHISTEIGDNLDAVSFDRQMLDQLPTLGHDAVEAISDLLEIISGDPSGVSVIVDGLEVSDPGLSASEIQEVKFNKNPYSAEFSKPGSGRIEIKTRRGSSRYHGSFAFGFRDYRLDARKAFALERPEEQRRLFAGDFSAPVGNSKKTTFFVSLWREEDDEQSVVNAFTPSGAFRDNVPSPVRTTAVSTRLNRQISEKNSASLRYSFSDWSSEGEGVGGFNLPETAADLTSRKHRFRYSHNTVVTSGLLNQLSFRAVGSETLTSSRQAGVIQTAVLDAFTGGGAQLDSRSSRNRFQFSDVLSWSVGKHTVKAGVNIPNFT